MTPDLTVGVAMHGVLVGSEEVAHDLSRLNELGVTHILNVAYGIPNSFPDVSIEVLKLASLFFFFFFFLL